MKLSDFIRPYPETKPEDDSACFVFYNEGSGISVHIQAAVYLAIDDEFLEYNQIGEVPIRNVIGYIPVDDEIERLENLRQ